MKIRKLTVKVEADCGVTLSEFILGSHFVLSGILHGHIGNRQYGYVQAAIFFYCQLQTNSGLRMSNHVQIISAKGISKCTF